MYGYIFQVEVLFKEYYDKMLLRILMKKEVKVTKIVSSFDLLFLDMVFGQFEVDGE